VKAELDAMIAAAAAAGRHIAAAARERRAPWPVDSKPGGERVTALDLESDALVRGALARAPSWPIVSEESLPAAGDLARALAAERMFMVDPLDGTEELLRGTGDVAVLVGLAARGRAVAGAVALPFEDLVLSGASGHGAFVDRGGQRRSSELSPRQSAVGCRLVVSRDRPPAFLPRLVERGRLPPPERRGAVGIKIALVALGRADLYIHAGRPVRSWDVCAAEAVLAAAGGRVTDLDGAPLDHARADLALRRGLIASSALLHDQALAMVREAMREAMRHPG
jgi:3'(2'), 5'-bisphosphate nucleotidase